MLSISGRTLNKRNKQMSIEQAQAFFEKVKNDEDLAKRLSEAPDSERKLEIARQEGFEFDLEEARKAKDEISDDELENIAGGGIFGCFARPSCYRDVNNR
ncbi:MAG: Nif11-like leader peptide family natural product precursor [Desulfohalobiaceae bacterium]